MYIYIYINSSWLKCLLGYPLQDRSQCSLRTIPRKIGQSAAMSQGKSLGAECPDQNRRWDGVKVRERVYPQNMKPCIVQVNLAPSCSQILEMCFPKMVWDVNVRGIWSKTGNLLLTSKSKAAPRTSPSGHSLDDGRLPMLQFGKAIGEFGTCLAQRSSWERCPGKPQPSGEKGVAFRFI